MRRKSQTHCDVGRKIWRPFGCKDYDRGQPVPDRRNVGTRERQPRKIVRRQSLDVGPVFTLQASLRIIDAGHVRAVRVQPPAGNHRVNHVLSLRVPRAEEQWRVIGHGTLSCGQHGLLIRVRRDGHDPSWRRCPEAGGLQGGLDMGFAAYPGERRGDWLTLPDRIQQQASRHQRAERGEKFQPLAQCEQLAQADDQPAQPADQPAQVDAQPAYRFHRSLLLFFSTLLGDGGPYGRPPGSRPARHAG